MFKNVTGQKIQLFAFDYSTGAPKTGDSANLTAYIEKDGAGSMTALGDTSATELSATNAPGWYEFDVTQSESNADMILFTAKSSTANVSVVGARVFTRPNRFTTMVIDSAGLVDANTVKLGPTGSGTAQTARDIGASVLLSSGTGTGQISLSSGLVTLAGVTHTGAVIPTVTTLTGHTAQTGDCYARLGAPAGASVSADVAAVKADTGAIKTKTDYLPSATAGSAGGVFIAGTNAATSITTALTANITGNLSGSVGSVTATVQADIDKINGVTITGDGQSGTEFGV